MKIAIPREAKDDELRTPVVPDGVEKLVQMGATVTIEAGLGQSIGLADDAYTEAGASVTASAPQSSV